MSSKAVVLARVSTRAQEEEGYSLDSQLKLLRDYCKTNSLVIDKEFKFAETASKQRQRVVFQELLEYVIKHRIHHFVVEKTDRLTRNMRDAASINDWLEEDDKRILHVVKENLQLHRNSRSHFKFMWGIQLTIAKQYTDNLREEAMKGWAEKLAQGWLPASPPPGYMTVTESGKRIHIPNPDTMYLVRRAFELYILPDYTIRLIALEMAKMGLTTRKGRPFAKSQVARMLSNPFYIGINRFDGKDYPGAQEPLISRELFEAVQKKLHGSQTKRRKHNPVFKGMIRCAHCGHMVTWQLQKDKYYGFCQRTQEACKGRRALREPDVEAQIIEELGKVHDPDGKILQRLRDAIEVNLYPYVGLHREKIIESLNRQLNRLEAMQDRLYEDKLSGDVTTVRYEEKNKALSDQITQIKDRLFKLYEVQSVQKQLEPKVDCKNRIVALYESGSPNQKRMIMAYLFEQLEYDGRDVLLRTLCSTK